MSDSKKKTSGNRELDLIKTLATEFRRQRKSGNRPKSEEFLGKVPSSDREFLFQNLLQQDLLFRRNQGENPESSEYVKRFPQYQHLIRQAFFESTQMSMEGENRSPSDSDESAMTQAFGFPGSSPLGEYELIRQLGRGGFGVVYEARHRTRQNVVALKTLPAARGGQEIDLAVWEAEHGPVTPYPNEEEVEAR